MARCEACGGPIREGRGTQTPADELIDVNKFEFDSQVGRRRARRTHFCSPGCAIRGLEDDLLNEVEDSMFWVDRRGDGPQNYPDPETEPLVRRAKALLETAVDGAGNDNLDKSLHEAVAAADDALGVLDEDPDVEERVHLATGDAIAAIYDGEKQYDAVTDATVAYNIVERRGSVHAEVVDALGGDLEVECDV